MNELNVSLQHSIVTLAAHVAVAACPLLEEESNSRTTGSSKRLLSGKIATACVNATL